MFTKSCEFCKNIINTRFVSKHFCNSTCQRKNYNSRDDIKNVKKAFSPLNLQLLAREENRRKSGKLIMGNPYKGKPYINNGE